MLRSFLCRSLWLDFLFPFCTFWSHFFPFKIVPRLMEELNISLFHRTLRATNNSGMSRSEDYIATTDLRASPLLPTPGLPWGPLGHITKWGVCMLVTVKALSESTARVDLRNRFVFFLINLMWVQEALFLSCSC